MSVTGAGAGFGVAVVIVIRRCNDGLRSAAAAIGVVPDNGAGPDADEGCV